MTENCISGQVAKLQSRNDLKHVLWRTAIYYLIIRILRTHSSNDNNDIKEESYLEHFMSNESAQDESRDIFHPPS